jgi:monofunctional biosynthetic peptidoglycan transglycosylase
MADLTCLGRRVALTVLLSTSLPMSAAAASDLATDGAPWQLVNDGVMGGVSSSRIEADADGVRFSGVVRTEYSGGFASARRALDAGRSVERVDGFVLRARGDGHRYRLTVYVRAAGGGLQPYSYYAEFTTEAGAVTEQALPLAQFRATFRGRAVPEAPPLAWRDVAGVGLMLLKDGHRDGRGPFALTLLSLRTAP